MLFVDNGGITDARLNLALEEHVLRNKVTEDDLLLYGGAGFVRVDGASSP